MESRIIARGTRLSREFRSLLEERMLIGIRRYHARISRCVARLEMEGNAPRHWVCAISADIDGGPHLDVSAKAEGCEASVEGAVHKIKDLLRKALGETCPMHA